jgi:hypothetical protein
MMMHGLANFKLTVSIMRVEISTVSPRMPSFKPIIGFVVNREADG